MHINRRNFLSLSAAAGLGIFTPVAGHANTIGAARIITGFPPGTTPDILARRISEKLVSTGYSKSAVVENRTGAGGQLAVSAVKNGTSDGSIILLTPMSMLGVYPFTYKKLPYDPIKDLTPVSNGARFDYGIGVGPAVPESVKTVPDLMTWFKANPGSANMASPATGSTLHFVTVMLGKSAGVDLTHIGYRGSSAAIQDMLGGTLPAICAPLGSFIDTYNGRLRLLATSGAQRSPFTKNISTLTEQGYSDMVFSEWYGFFLPTGTDKAIVTRLNETLRSALDTQDIATTLAQFAMEPAPTSPEELAATLQADMKQWGPIVKSIGFSADGAG